MGHSFARQELYNLVWSEPMRDIAARFQISDVGLAKACRNAAIPVPPRGFWNKKKAGHRVAQFPLPPREPGHRDAVTIGQDRYWHYPPEPIDENEPDPPAPTFAEPIEAVRARVEKRTDAVRVRKDFSIAHPAIRKLLEKDEKLREQQRQYAWYKPVFDTPLQRRRLRIWNALLLALSAQGCSGSINDEKAQEITASIGISHLRLTLEIIPLRGHAAKDADASKRERLRLSLKSYRHDGPPQTLADDEPEKPIEQRLRAIIVDLMVIGEERYRADQIQSHKWTVQRRHERIAEARKAREEAVRKERERIAALEKARVDRLLDEAQALQRARDIREYVAQVRTLNPTLDPPMPDDALEQWAHWALAQAERIDPVRSRRFLDVDDLKSGAGGSSA
ncbi:hypothetical protein [Hyphomicrobium sp. NDB2Meth4]|uniref:hypothetical protein n=1 Tax=Hyphomicrobium sp. NDB2Meth4 TaxID=1892846 RepID=UPI000930E6DD|nr:hypothetical protein [Hyphomicrobium sp. NDB2Meth4]